MWRPVIIYPPYCHSNHDFLWHEKCGGSVQQELHWLMNVWTIDWLFSSKYVPKFKCCIQFIDSWGGVCGLCIRWICLLLQGLLKVAIDNARTQEKQVQLEKTELKMELFRERELRETLEKQLAVEQKNRGVYYSKHTHYCTHNLLYLL